MDQIDQNQIKKTFDELYSIEANKKCFECESFNNKWASVNNGIFLCINCAQIHRNMGINISFVRSVELDFWTESQLNQMIKGGNENLSKFFKQYSIQSKKASGENTKEEIQYKYRTKASEYYRTYLKCQADGVQPPTAPTLEEGVQLFVDINSPDFNQIYNPLNSGENQSQETQNQNEQKNVIVQKFQIFKGFVGKQIDDINEKIKQTHIKEDLVKFGDKIADKSKDLGQKTAKFSKEVYTDAKQFIQDKTSSNKEKLKFQEVYIDQNQQQQGSDEQQQQTRTDTSDSTLTQVRMEQQKPLLPAQEVQGDDNNINTQDQQLHQNEFEQKQNKENQEEEKKTSEVIKQKLANTYTEISDFTKKGYDAISKKLTPDEQTKVKFKAAQEKVSQKTSEIGHTVITETKQIGEKTATFFKKGFATLVTGIGEAKNKLTNKQQDQSVNQNIQNSM